MTEALNIAIMGTHKTGKTTLYNEVVKGLQPEWKIKCLDELAVERISEANTFFKFMAMQEDILIHQLKVLKWAKENEVSTFSDRSLIDNLVYMVVGRYSSYTYALSGDSKKSRDILEALSPVVSEAITHFYDYDLLFYIPVEFKLGEPTKEQLLYQWSINDIIKHLLNVYGIRHHVIKGTVEEIKTLVLETIKQYMEGERNE